ncbi:MAG: DMT family transporter [Ralstonia sp.]|jgi:S-adenosylmethionine uptake transporter|nr:MAG: DMT family transporter [Ralstonia sp.]
MSANTTTEVVQTAAQTADNASRQSLWMILAAFAFSAMGVCVKLASAHYSTGEIVFYRSVIGMIVMGAILAKTGAGIRTPYLTSHIKRSVFGVTSLLLWFTSISLLPLATAMTLNYMSPVWIALIIGAGATLAGKTGGADRKMVSAILMSFIGVICLLQPSVGASQMTGGMVGLVSGVFTALAYVEVRQLGDLGENEARIVFYFSLISAIAGGVWMLIGGAQSHTWHSAGLLLAVGLLATLGQTAMTRAYKRGNTLLTANLQYTGIVFASGWGMLLWHDHLNALSWLGMALIIGSGIVTTVMRARQSGTEHPTPQTAVSGPEAEIHPEV